MKTTYNLQVTIQGTRFYFVLRDPKWVNDTWGTCYSLISWLEAKRLGDFLGREDVTWSTNPIIWTTVYGRWILSPSDESDIEIRFTPDSFEYQELEYEKTVDLDYRNQRIDHLL